MPPSKPPIPSLGIHAAVTRQDRDDHPPKAGTPRNASPSKRPSEPTPRGAARSCPYLPNVTGTLSPGSAADLLILDRDIFTIPPPEIKHTHPLATLVAGHPIHDPHGLFYR